MDDDPPRLSEAQIKRLESQFYALFIEPSRPGFLVRKFAKTLRSQIDPEYAAALVLKRFSGALRNDNAEIINHVIDNGLASIVSHLYFRKWIYWTTKKVLREYYDSISESGPSVSIEMVGDLSSQEPGIEELLDGDEGHFLSRMLNPLVHAGTVLERDAEIFVTRLTAYWKNPDKGTEEFRQPSLREIGARYGLGTSQVARIVANILKLLETPDIQEIIQRSLDQNSNGQIYDDAASVTAGQEPARKVLP